MPRKSRFETSVQLRVDGRPNPLRPRDDAPKEIAEIFRSLIASVPVEHFRPGDSDLVEQHAQSIALARRAYAELEANGPVVNGKASPWLIVLEKAHRSAVALSARLRLAPQSRTEARSTASERTPAIERPWE